MTAVAVMGLGAMGSRIAQNLLKAGHDVVVYNRTAARAASLVALGATLAPSPRAAAEQSAVVIALVTDDLASRQLWLAEETGALNGLTSAAVAVEMSTLTVSWVQELAAAVAEQGAQFLEAPVVGSRPQAERGQLIALVGGQPTLLDQVRPVLTAAVASRSHHLGSVGQGTAMKLAVNTLFGVQVAALGELLGLLAQAGIAPAQAIACLGELPVLSPAAAGAGGLMVAQNHAPLFPIDLVAKDFTYVAQLAQHLDAPLPVGEAVAALYQSAIATGYGGDNITGVARLFA